MILTREKYSTIIKVLSRIGNVIDTDNSRRLGMRQSNENPISACQSHEPLETKALEYCATQDSPRTQSSHRKCPGNFYPKAIGGSKVPQYLCIILVRATTDYNLASLSILYQ